jgi:hypothetical protein
MKYIIPENRLQNIIFKYLDDKLNGFEWRKGQYSDIVLALHGEEYGLMGWKKHDKLYVNWEFVDEIKLMFSMLKSESLDVIGRYVESRYNLKVNHTPLFYFLYRKMLRVDTI